MTTTTAAAVHDCKNSTAVADSIAALVSDLRSSDATVQYGACKSLERIASDAPGAVPALLEVYKRSFYGEPGYPYPNRAALFAAVAIAKELPYNSEIQAELQKTLLEGVRCAEPNVSRTSVGGLNQLASARKLSDQTLAALSEMLSVNDHTSVRDRAGVLGVLLHAMPGDGLAFVEHIIGEGKARAEQIDTILRPEDRRLGVDGDFVVSIKRPGPPGLIDLDSTQQLLVIYPDGFRAIQRESISNGCTVYFDGGNYGARKLYDSLVERPG